MSRPWKLLALLLSLAVVFAACGDDDDSGDDSSEESSGDVSDDVLDDLEDDQEDLAEDVISDQLGGECGFLGEFAGAGIGSAFDPTSLMNPTGSTDFGALFAPLAEELQEVAAAAPGDIRGDFELVAGAFAELAGEMEGIVIDFSDPSSMDPAALEQLEGLGEIFESDEINTATENIDAWIEENCGA